MIHWVGRKANISDVHAGLILQRHAPFVFHFDNIALINPSDTKSIASLLDLLVSSDVRTADDTFIIAFSVKSMAVLLVHPKTIVFGRTYVLAQMFFIFFATRDLRDAWADRREILHDGQY